MAEFIMTLPHLEAWFDHLDPTASLFNRLALCPTWSLARLGR